MAAHVRYRATEIANSIRTETRYYPRRKCVGSVRHPDTKRTRFLQMGMCRSAADALNLRPARADEDGSAFSFSQWWRDSQKRARGVTAPAAPARVQAPRQHQRQHKQHKQQHQHQHKHHGCPRPPIPICLLTVQQQRTAMRARHQRRVGRRGLDLRHDVRQPLLEARHLAGQPHRFAEVVSLLPPRRLVLRAATTTARVRRRRR
jgi:hypothetical protein